MAESDHTGESRHPRLCLAAHPEEHVCDLLAGHGGAHLCGEDPGECDYSWTDESDGEDVLPFVVLRRSDVEALIEEWGDLEFDPFWRPLSREDLVLVISKALHGFNGATSSSLQRAEHVVSHLAAHPGRSAGQDRGGPGPEKGTSEGRSLRDDPRGQDHHQRAAYPGRNEHLNEA